jgi:membrane protease YdiL (CAAX protease family)
MNGLTHFPSNRVYAIAVVALLSASAATLTDLIHRWRRAQPVSFLPMYTTTIGCVVVLALILLGVPTLEWLSWRAFAFALTGGLVACWAALRGESFITRALLRGYHTGATWRLPVGSELFRLDPTEMRTNSRTSVLVWLLLIGAGEEMLFRGILIDLAQLTPGGPAMHGVLITASVFAFALSHAQLGLGEALRKMPLSVACLVAYMLSGTLLAPITAHVGYNTFRWRARPHRLSGRSAAPARTRVRSEQ